MCVFAVNNLKSWLLFRLIEFFSLIFSELGARQNERVYKSFASVWLGATRNGMKCGYIFSNVFLFPRHLFLVSCFLLLLLLLLLRTCDFEWQLCAVAVATAVQFPLCAFLLLCLDKNPTVSIFLFGSVCLHFTRAMLLFFSFSSAISLSYVLIRSENVVYICLIHCFASHANSLTIVFLCVPVFSLCSLRSLLALLPLIRLHLFCCQFRVALATLSSNTHPAGMSEREKKKREKQMKLL